MLYAIATAKANIAGIISTVLSTYIWVWPAMPKVITTPPITANSGQMMPLNERVMMSITMIQMTAAIITSRPISCPMYTDFCWVTYGMPVALGFNGAYFSFAMIRLTSPPVTMSGDTLPVFFHSSSVGKARSFTNIQALRPSLEMSLRAT